MPSNSRIPLILLPGMDGSGELFADFVAHLPSEIEPKIARFAPNQALGYEALAHRLVKLLPEDRPCVLLGESFSGPLAIKLAAARASKQSVRALILSASFARSPVPVPPPLHALIDLVPIELLPKRLIADYFFGASKDERLMQRLLGLSEQLTPAVWRTRVKAALEVDVSAPLRKLKLPLLYLRARNDRLVPRQQAELVKQLAPQTRIVDFDTPHFLLQMAPREAARVVGEFVEQAIK